MVFVSPIFLFLFFPIVLGVCLLLKPKYRNAWLCFASFMFYSWGGISCAVLILISTVVNYFCGIKIENSTGKSRKRALVLGVGYNLVILIFFKYFHFLVNSIFGIVGVSDVNLGFTIPLPIGISFFTFQIISYIVDVYRNNVKAQRSLLNLSLYIMLFPQLIAGPIVRYIDVEQEIRRREINIIKIRSGLERFIIGLAKKMILSNPMGEIANFAFNNPGELNTVVAWIGIIGYSLQIYFDFSAYSDMAIGLGRVFGFTFLENFNYPYISCSIQEFWRRWHISLSSWFKDYVYIPLGGNRQGTIKTYRNLMIVFLLTGLWHGASWNFVIWGLFHGVFLIIERVGLGRLLNKLPKILQHIYALIVVSIGWVFFRADTLREAIIYIKEMFSFNLEGMNRLFIILDARIVLSLLVALICSMPIYPLIKKYIRQYVVTHKENYIVLRLCADIYIAIVFIISLTYIAGCEFNPFIYFRF